MNKIFNIICTLDGATIASFSTHDKADSFLQELKGLTCNINSIGLNLLFKPLSDFFKIIEIEVDTITALDIFAKIQESIKQHEEDMKNTDEYCEDDYE
jgi:hypothetical protein